MHLQNLNRSTENIYKIKEKEEEPRPGGSCVLTIVHLAVAAAKPGIALAVIVVWPCNAHTVRHAGLVVARVLRTTCEHALQSTTTLLSHSEPSSLLHNKVVTLLSTSGR